MAKQANRMMIGGFVVVAVVLLAASLVVFGSGRFFKKTIAYVLYFDSSIKGLNVGAPVLFQGVPVGSVKSISIHADVKKLKAEIPVIIEIEPERFVTSDMRHAETEEEIRNNLDKLIGIGMRAVLSTQSFITGQLMVEIDFFPGTPVSLKNIDKDLPEIPTIPSTTERLAQTLQKLDLKGMQESLENTLAGIDRLVNNPDLSDSIGELKGVMVDARRLTQNLDARVGSVADEFDATLRDTRQLVGNVDRQVAPFAKNMNATVKEFGRLVRDTNTRLGSVMGSMDKTLSAARGVIGEDAPLVVELETTLREISDMARAFRELADYLQRHPEALIQGKGKSGGK